MTNSSKHGHRLTQREYQRAVINLHKKVQNGQLKDVSTVRRAELELNIDYRLGVEFPKEKRDRLWEIQQEIEKRRFFLAASWAANRLLSRMVKIKVNRLAQLLINEYGKVLSQSELDDYFGSDDANGTGFPFNSDF